MCVAVSWKEFSYYKPSLHKYAEHLESEEIGKCFFRLLKETNASENIKILGYYTKKHSQGTLKKPTFQKEMSAVYNGLKFFEKTFAGTRTFLLSDNLPTKQLLQSMKSKDISVHNLMAKIINEFPNVEVVYCEGKKNLADIFSRATGVENPLLDFKKCHLPALVEGKYFFFNTVADWVHCTGDETSGQVEERTIANTGAKLKGDSQRPRTEAFSAPLSELVGLPSLANAYTETERTQFGKKYKECSGVYYGKEGRIVVPSARAYHVVAFCHKSLGHAGIRKLESYISKTYIIEDFSKFREKLSKYVQSCVGCLLANPQRLPVKQGSTLISVSAPMKFVSFDVAEFNRQARNTRYNFFSDKFLIVIDHYSGHVSSYPLSNITEQEITKALMAFIATNGVPNYFLSDNARPLHSEGVRRLLDSLGIVRINSAVYSSRARGACERAVQSLRHIVRLLQTDNANVEDWRPGLKQRDSGYEVLLWLLATNIYNHIPHTSKFTPHEILNSFNQVSYVFLTNNKRNNYQKRRHEWNSQIKAALNILQKERGKRLETKNKHRVGSNIELFDLVIVKERNQNKNRPLFSSAIYKVTDRFSHSAQIERLADGAVQCRNYNELKRVSECEEFSDLDDEKKNMLGILGFSRTDLKSQQPKLETRMKTRAMTKSEQEEHPENLGIFEQDDLDEAEKGVRFLVN